MLSQDTIKSLEDEFENIPDWIYKEDVVEEATDGWTSYEESYHFIAFSNKNKVFYVDFGYNPYTENHNKKDFFSYLHETTIEELVNMIDEVQKTQEEIGTLC